jgi:hypothetical protein
MISHRNIPKRRKPSPNNVFRILALNARMIGVLVANDAGDKQHLRANQVPSGCVIAAAIPNLVARGSMAACPRTLHIPTEMGESASFKQRWRAG